MAKTRRRVKIRTDGKGTGKNHAAGRTQSGRKGAAVYRERFKGTACRPRQASAPTSSWWTDTPEQGFSERARREFAERMRNSLLNPRVRRALDDVREEPC